MHGVAMYWAVPLHQNSLIHQVEACMSALFMSKAVNHSTEGLQQGS
jgi:hypothetical protein